MRFEPILVFVLQTLKEEWRAHKELKHDERHEFQLLEDELQLLNSFLKDSARKSDKSELFKEREKQIKDLAYEVEDTIEMCLIKKASAKTNNIFVRCVQKLNSGMAKQVRSLREKKLKRVLDFIDKDLGRHVGSEEARTNTEVTILMDRLDESELVDFEEDEECLIGYLNEVKWSLHVISITGMPGLGKTALAMKVYESIRSKFSISFWVQVSQHFNCKSACLKIFEALKPGEPVPSDQTLVATVRKALADKAFLLVFDDVCSVADWEAIDQILPKENVAGKVVLTTRDWEVAAHASREPHQLGLMGKSKSWELLKLKIFGHPPSCPLELEEIGQAIAIKCGGVPLAVVVVGGILKSLYIKTRSIVGVKEKWIHVRENMHQILNEDKNNRMWSILQLSYNTLPDELKACFLYIGLFPESRDILASELTQLWIDEGFIRSKSGGSLEDAAHEILDQLINRNMLMVSKKSIDRVRACRVHQIIREFCRAKAAEDNFYEVVKESTDHYQLGYEFRRLCLYSDPSKLLSTKPKGPSLRSFLYFLEETFDLDPVRTSAVSDGFDVLRIFSCKSIMFRKFPDFSRLMLLKHISLSIDPNVMAVPEHITHLLNLRTLMVYTKTSNSSRSIRVKANISKMIQLRRLQTNAAFLLDDHDHDKRWIDKVGCTNTSKTKCGQTKVVEANLETLSRLSPMSCTERLCEKAPKLKTLGIRGGVKDLFKTFSLEKFLLLKEVKIMNASSMSPPLFLTQSCSFPPSLKRLTLSKTNLLWDQHMPILAGIKSLEVLKLKDYAFTGVSWNDVGEGFKSLQLMLIETTRLATWKAKGTDFPLLRYLILRECEFLEEIPKGLHIIIDKLELRKATAELVN